jgi:hypothetical protein
VLFDQVVARKRRASWNGNRTYLNIQYLLTGQTLKVVVMAQTNSLIPGFPIWKNNFINLVLLSEQLECSVDGRNTKARDFVLSLRMHFLYGQWTLRILEHLENYFPLTGVTFAESRRIHVSGIPRREM